MRIKFWEDLNDYVLSILSEDIIEKSYWNKYIFSIFYNTGIRLNEIVTLEIDAEDENWSLTVIASKDSYSRIFYKDDNEFMKDINPEILSEILKLNTYSKTKRLILKYIPIIQLKSNDYNTISHIFRYLYIYRLYANGYTVSEIQEFIGHKSPTTTSLYISNINSMTD